MHPRPSKYKVQIDPAALEEQAAAGLDVPAAARALRVNPGTLYKRLREDAASKEAWRRGQARREGGAAGAQAAEALPDIPATVTPKAAAVAAALRAERRSRREIKEHSGLDYGAVNRGIDELEGLGLVYGREDGAGIMRYYFKWEKPAGGA